MPDSGATNTAELLTTLTSNSMVGATNQAEGAGLSTYGESTASLRGLGASKTLVLVNGRRLGNYATDGTAVDVNSIPLASIDHVEVLKDGASGVYGSDAIGGVINFITKKNYQGVELNGYTSASRYGGGQTHKASILAGWGDFDADRYNFTRVGRRQQGRRHLRPPARLRAATAGTTTASAIPARPRAAT